MGFYAFGLKVIISSNTSKWEKSIRPLEKSSFLKIIYKTNYEKIN
jgi:hypothetical protein